MSHPILRIENLSVHYDRVRAVKNCSLEVPAGSIVAVLGANGAGKSSLLNAIVGAVHSSGDVFFEGISVRSLKIEERVALGMSLVPERRELFGSLSVEDNLRLGAFRLDGKTAAIRIEEVGYLFPRLVERREQKAVTLSGGERQMLAMGRALVSNPQLLMLDEPSLGLGPLIIQDVFKVILQLRSRGTSMLIVEQNARAALSVADFAYVFELGSVTHYAPATEILQDPRLQKAYLGR